MPLVNSSDFLEDQIDGEAFCELTEEDVKAIVKPLGVVKRITRLLKSAVQPTQTVRSI